MLKSLGIMAHELSGRTRGYLSGIIAGLSFGLIPLFSMPVIEAGMDNVSILVYRFLFGSMGLLAILLYQKTSLRITMRQLLRISLLSLFYIGTAITTLKSYEYLSSGVATALVYTDPIWCALIGLIFFRDRLSLKVSSSIIITVVGVMLLTSVFTETIRFSALGVMWGLLSGLTYALYLIFLPRLDLKSIPGLKLTFYVFFVSMIILAVMKSAFGGGIETASQPRLWADLVLLGLIPTALSNICVTTALRLIDSTVVALLGAMEPVTAMTIGICVLGDPFSLSNIAGAALILAAVFILTAGDKN